MPLNPGTAAKQLRKWAIGGAIFVVSTVAGGFILALCDDAGWFKKPWEKVAALIALAHWLTGNPWVHWIGGGIIGFAIGVWLDDVLRRSAAKGSGEEHSAAPGEQKPPTPVIFGKVEISFASDNDAPGARLEVTLTVKSRARDVVIFGRFATPYHYISDSEWKWSTSSRLIERADLVAGETVRAEIFKRVPMVLDSSDKLKILGQELQLPSNEVTADGCLVLIEIKAMADAADEIAVRRLFQFRRVGARQMIDALDLDSHSFITDQGALR